MHKSTFLYKSTTDTGLGVDVEQAKRNLMRKFLQSVGFVWRKTSGVPAGEEWNIDNYPTIALQNMIDAHEQYGSIVAEMHNLKKFNRITAADFGTVMTLIEKELERRKEPVDDSDGSDTDSDNGSSSGGSNNSGSGSNDGQTGNGSNNSDSAGNGSGGNNSVNAQSAPPWLLPAAVGAGGLLLLLALR